MNAKPVASQRERFILVVSTLAVFFLTLRPVASFDTLFGIAIGRSVIETGKLPDIETFSWAAQGRPWIPYEWLPQTAAYLLFESGGFRAIEVAVSLLFSIFFITSWLTFRRVLGLGATTSLLLALFLVVSLLEFFVARPQIVTYLFFMAMVAVIWHLVLNGRNMLWVLIPMMFIWVNSHGAFIIGLGLLFSSVPIAYWYHRWGTRDRARSIATTLFWYACAAFAVTLFPPLWYKPYLLLWQFFRDLTFITKFVSEWGPLSINPLIRLFHLGLAWSVLAMVAAVSLWKWRKGFRMVMLQHVILVSPLILLLIASFQAIRHVPIGTIAGVLTLAVFLRWMSLKKHPVLRVGVAGAFFVATMWLWLAKRVPTGDPFSSFTDPSLAQDVRVIKELNLQGHLFNEFAVGGFLIHALFPPYRVFFDGRADVYHCCELRDFWPLIEKKRASPEEFEDAVDRFINKYDFSFLIIPAYTYNPFESTATTLMVDVLLSRQEWREVFVSDHFRIIVRDDGRNDDIFRQGLVAATPYRLHPFREGMATEAIEEYERLIAMNESGIARYGLGAARAAIGEDAKAQRDLMRAIELNPLFGHPFLELAKLAVLRQEIDEAIELADRAINTSPFLGEAYLIKAENEAVVGRRRRAIDTLELGLSRAIDFLSRQRMVNKLHSLSQPDTFEK